MIAVWFSKFMVAIMFIVTAMYIVMAIINTVMIIYLKSFGLSTSLIIAVMSLYMSMQVEKCIIQLSNTFILRK